MVPTLRSRRVLAGLSLLFFLVNAPGCGYPEQKVPIPRIADLPKKNNDPQKG